MCLLDDGGGIEVPSELLCYVDPKELEAVSSLYRTSIDGDESVGHVQFPEFKRLRPMTFSLHQFTTIVSSAYLIMEIFLIPANTVVG